MARLLGDIRKNKLDMITYREVQRRASTNIKKVMRKNKGKNFMIDLHSFVPTILVFGQLFLSLF